MLRVLMIFNASEIRMSLKKKKSEQCESASYSIFKMLLNISSLRILANVPTPSVASILVAVSH